MRTVSRELFACLNSEQASPIDLLEIRLQASGVAYEKRFTNAGHDVTISGKTYMPIAFSRSQLREELITKGGSGAPLSVSVSNVNGDLARLLNKVQLDGASATFSTTDRRLLNRVPSVPPMVISKGTIRNVQLAGRVGSFEIEPVSATIDRMIGPKRLMQKKCGVRFGSISCGVDITASPNMLDTAAQTGSTREYVVIDEDILGLIPVKHDRTGEPLPIDPSDFWAESSVYCLTGDNAAAWRPFARYQLSGSEHRLWFKYGFSSPFIAGDQIRIVRGCRKTKADCFDRQGNLDAYQGFDAVPLGTVNAEPLRVS